MIVLVYLIVLVRKFLFPLFFAWCIPALPFIQLNDFYTCYTFIIFALRRKLSYVHAHVSVMPRSRDLEKVKWDRNLAVF